MTKVRLSQISTKCFLLTGVTWFVHKIHMIFTGHTWFILYIHDIYHAVSNLHSQSLKLGRKPDHFGGKSEEEKN